MRDIENRCVMDVINLAAKLSQFDERWSPRIVGELNGQHVKLAKLEGEFIWHHHDDADELFLVLCGKLIMHFRDRDVTVGEGEMLIVPRGVEHKPEAPKGAHVLLFEPAGTLNTGNVRDELTIDEPPRV
jgi:mannose-6-phosphate isomerase-like protein (cupin superfamily)